MPKHMMNWLVATVFICATILTGCSREEPPPAPVARPAPEVPAPMPPVATPAQPVTPSAVSPTRSMPPPVAFAPQGPPPVLLAEPVPLVRTELPAEALAVWRNYAQQRPTLLVLSSDPMLVPVPERLRAEAQPLLTGGSRDELARRGSLAYPDPLLLPAMTVDASLRAGWFSQVVWALPLRDSSKELSIEIIRKQLHESGMLSEDELQKLSIDRHLLRGSVQGTPLQAAALDRLPRLTGPVVVHIDQSYFQDRYKNEAATPLLPIVYDTLYQLRERRLSVLAVTFTYGNLEERIALDVRFIGEMLAHFIEHPERSQQPAPPNWQRQADIFHLESLFEKDRIRDLALTMEKDAPESAWVKYTLYRAAALKKAGDFALDYLTEAVKRDRLYAVEYLSLAKQAYDRKRPDAALQMLKLAAEAFPDNPHIRLQVAKLTAETGDRTMAQQLVAELQTLPWSPVFYPQMPEYLKGFAEYLHTAPPAPRAAAAEPNPPPSAQPATPLPMGHPGAMPPGHP